MGITEASLKTAAQAEMLANRLKKRYRHLRKWARRIGTDAFRLYDRDIPEIPLVLDLYGDAVAGAVYERPYEKETPEEDRWLGSMGEAISRVLDIPLNRIFLKKRSRQRGKAQYERITGCGEFRDVREGGLLFRVNLSEYLDTGLFLDHRKTRSLIRAIAPGKRVLNLFCYTASFSVYAASAGARSVDSLDMSNTYLDWAKTNFTLNNLEARQITPRDLVDNKAALPSWRLIPAEAIRFLEGAIAAGLSWDIIILDPPAFSNSKKMSAILDLKRDHRNLIGQCLKLLSPEGKLLFSANAKNFTLNRPDFPEAEIEDLQEKIRDEDFSGKRLPAVYSFTLRRA
ncbi:MAG: class I SAM-dependent methyltransferase [Treponema sp.]|jgi:23S rRNA G2069 N7-methylase RlmK/C1962 C5-methylase RlmI|nr:class I SAM-dependent methyltransferase [Treponema sp.]